MRKMNWVHLLAIGLMVALVIGCSDKPEEKGTVEKAVEQVKEGAKAVTEKTGEVAEKAVEGAKVVAEKTGEVAKDAAEGTKEAVESAASWTKEKMEEYLGKMGEQLSGFEEKFKDLSAKAEGLTGEAKENFKEQFQNLTEKKDAATKEMEALKGASGDAWAAAKGRFDAIMKELKDLYDKIVAEFAGN